MPLILISGYPSSGKTYRSNQLRQYLENKIASITTSSDSTLESELISRVSRLTVVLVNDQTLGIDRGAYSTAKTEKDARAALSSVIKRELGKDRIVIADALNYIKGFRYQLFCEAKALQTPSCVIHVGTPIERCREINDRLLADPESNDGYATELFENLVFRYEEPNGMSRWDSPLFTVLYDDEEPPFEAIWEALVGSDGKGKVVRPNQATVLAPATTSTALYALEKSTSDIISTIQTYLSDHQGETGGIIRLSDPNVPALQLPTTSVTLPQLQRLRRQFVALCRSQVSGGDVKADRFNTLFVEFLNGQWAEDG